MRSFMLFLDGHTAPWIVIALAVGVGCSDKPKDDDPVCTLGHDTELGTIAQPLFFEVSGVEPAAGTTSPNQDIVQAFTLVKAPGILPSFTFQQTANHTAGDHVPSDYGFTSTQMGQDLRYESQPVSWTTAPGKVELNVRERYLGPDGCVYAFADPLFSYSLTEGAGGNGPGAGGTGGGTPPTGGNGPGAGGNGPGAGGGPMPPNGGAGPSPAGGSSN